MTLNNPSPPGANSTPEYLASGVPFITTSAIPANTTLGLSLPYVSRDVTIRNLGTGSATLRVGVSSRGAQTSNYFVLQAGVTEKFQVRTSTLFINNSTVDPISASILVGLTLIPYQNFPLLTGSNGWFDVSGSGIG